MGRNSMTREEAMSYRSIEKNLPTKSLNANYHGADLDEVFRRMNRNKVTMPCPYCGFAMEPFVDKGNADIWRCHTTNCPNNPDDKVFHMDMHDIDTKLLYNQARYTQSWMPRRLC